MNYEEIVFLTSAILGLVTVFLIGSRSKNRQQTNVYLVAIFITSSIRFLFNGLSGFSTETNYLKQLDLLIFVSTSPLVFLYFKKLVSPFNRINKNDVFYLLILFVLFLTINYTTTYYHEGTVDKAKAIALLSLNVFYAVKSFLLLNKLVWKRNSDILILNRQNILIKKWTYVFFGFYIFMFLRFNLNLIVQKNGAWYLYNNDFLWITALIWIALYLKVIFSPEFLYGYDLIRHKINEYEKNKIVFHNIWDLKRTNTHTNQQDNTLKEKVDLENYITKIEQLALNNPILFNESFKLNDLSSVLNIPKSHVVYVFKYHSKISFNDFKKIIRIQSAVNLIKGDYLKINTLEALSAEVGFTSYSAFFKSFKSVIGVSPKEYCDKI